MALGNPLGYLPNGVQEPASYAPDGGNRISTSDYAGTRMLEFLTVGIQMNTLETPGVTLAAAIMAGLVQGIMVAKINPELTDRMAEDFYKMGSHLVGKTPEFVRSRDEQALVTLLDLALEFAEKALNDGPAEDIEAKMPEL